MNEKIKTKIANFLQKKTEFLKLKSLVHDSHISKLEADQLLLFLSQKKEFPWMYLDRNEYKGSIDGIPYEKWLKNKQIEEIKKDKLFGPMNAAVKYSNHNQLSYAVFLTWKEILDIPSYIHVIKPTFLNNEWNLNNLIHNTMQSTRFLVESHKTKNKIYENNSNGKSKWMNDVENGILF